MKENLKCLIVSGILMSQAGFSFAAETLVKPYEAAKFSVSVGKIDRLVFDALRKAELAPGGSYFELAP